MPDDTATTTGKAQVGRFRSAASGAAAVVVVSLALVALIFSNSIAVRRVSNDAQVLYRAEATLGANSLAVKALSQAVLLAEDQALGVADEATSMLALREASQTLDDLSETSQALLIQLDGDQDLEGRAQSAISAGTHVIDLLAAGQVEDAGTLLSSDAKGAFEALRDVAGGHRDAASKDVTSTTDLISRVANLPAFFIAFLLPIAAILAYRRIARNQLHLAEIQLDARLESERHLVRAKDEFVANISHELRTPLTSIYGFSELLLDQGFVDPDSSMELLAMINSESGELHRMVEDLLTSARSEGGTITIKPSIIDLQSIMEAELGKLHLTRQRVETEIVVEKAWADGERVRQIVRNLLSNAMRYGGPNIRLLCDAKGDHATLMVADDGPGVDPSKMVRLFTRYVHDGSDPLLVGSIGLGLSVVRILAEAMGGDARYERDDDWSKFIVRLPVSEQAAISSRLTPARSGSLPPQVAATLDSTSSQPARPLVEEPYFEAV